MASSSDTSGGGSPIYSIQQVKVYTDVTDDALVACIQRAATGLVSPSPTMSNQVVLVTESELAQRVANAEKPKSCASPSSAPSSSPPSVAFIQEWERDRADFKAAVNDPLRWMNHLTCFITHKYSLRSGPVAYALHCMQIPVLTLCDDANPLPRSHPAVPLPTEEVLFFNAARLSPGTHGDVSVSSAARCIDAFFSTFASSHTAKLVALEHVHDDESSKLTRDAPGSGSRHALMGAVAHALTASNRLPPGSVVCVDEAGFPAWSGSAPHACKRTASQPEDGVARGGSSSHPYARVAPAFEHLLNSLTDGEHGAFTHLLRDSPQLVGALCAFNRYQNRGLIRALVQQGRTVVFFNFVRRTAESLSSVTGEAEPEAFATNLSAVLRFESHWLELPLPRDGFIVQWRQGAPKRVDDEGEVEAPRWVTRLSQARGTEPSTPLCELAPWLQRDVVVLHRGEEDKAVQQLVAAVENLLC